MRMAFHTLTEHRLSGVQHKTSPAAGFFTGFFIGGEATREAFYSRLSEEFSPAARRSRLSPETTTSPPSLTI
jgi:hypothetical protein